MVENPPANAGDLRDAGSIPGWERSPGGGHGNPSSILAWRITWTEEPGRLHSPWSCRRVTERLSIHTHTHTHVIKQALPLKRSSVSSGEMGSR